MTLCDEIFLMQFKYFSDPWTGSDRDYQYDELLDRVFGIMRDKNPEMVGGKQKKFVMRPPQVWLRVKISAVKRSIGSTTGCTITEKAPTRAFSWLKAATSAFTFKTLC